MKKLEVVLLCWKSCEKKRKNRQNLTISTVLPRPHGQMVEISGIEPLTSWMPFKRSPSWAIPPWSWNPWFYWVSVLFDCRILRVVLLVNYPQAELCSSKSKLWALFSWFITLLTNKTYTNKFFPICQHLILFFSKNFLQTKIGLETALLWCEVFPNTIIRHIVSGSDLRSSPEKEYK